LVPALAILHTILFLFFPTHHSLSAGHVHPHTLG
jgi:hypothetical protein